ncbi:MAG: hypothetical protein ACFFC1_12605 [Promethearchaeota archaeon]
MFLTQGYGQIEVTAQIHDSSVVNEVSTMQSLTIREVYDDVKEAINGLADALKVPTERVYEVLIKQQKLRGLCNLIPIPIFVIFLTLFIISAKLSDWRDAEANNGYAILSIITCACAIISLVVTFICLPNAIKQLNNPEYYAIQEIINFIK